MLIKVIPSFLLSIKRLSLSAFIVAFPLLAQAQTLSIDKVMAIVDDEVVLQSEFDARLDQVLQQFSEDELASVPLEELHKQLLDQLIIENLQLQMAFRAGIRLDDNMLNQALTTIAQQNDMTFDDFRALLETNGEYLSTRRQVSNEISIQQFQSGAVNQRIDVTRQEVENYLRSEAGISDIAPEYHVAHLLIPNSSTAPDGGEEELAMLLYDQLLQGENIMQIAAAREISGMAVSGGDLGWNKAETLPSIFSSVVPELGPGDVSKPFSSSSGYHIVQLLELRGGSSLQIDQTHLRHIMIAPNEIRTEEQSKDFVQELYQQILNGADFADIARLNTDDPGSMVSGGDLDWVGPGQLPEDYMAVIQSTEIGQVTEPFRVSSGWHIIEVLERRVEDVTEDNKRYQAQQILRNRKFENELQNWLTEIRDTAYIDIKEQ